MSHYLVGSLILYIGTFSVWGMIVSKIPVIKQEILDGLPVNIDWSFYALLFIFIIGFIFTIYLYLNSLKLSREYLTLKCIAEDVGIKSFYPHKTQEDKKHDWDILECGLKNISVKNLYILGLTGWNTFGTPKSMLHNVISKLDGTVNILLLNPKSDAFKTRMTELKANEEHHKQELINTLKSCQLMKQAGVDINISLYTQKPIWKMIFTDNYMWLQHYSKNNHVDDTPVYVFYKNKNDTSIFTPLTEVFQKRLNDDGSILVDLDSKNFEDLFNS